MVPSLGAGHDAIVGDRLTEAGIPDLRHARGDFVGIDGVFYATEPWGINEAPERLADLLPERCSSATNFPQIDERERVQTRAANATYLSVLLTRLFAGSGHRLVRAVPTRRDGETLLTWTRGYLIRRYSGKLADG